MKVSYSWSNQPSGMKSKVPSDEYYHYGDNVMVDTTYNNKSGYKEEKWQSNTYSNFSPSDNIVKDVLYFNDKFITLATTNIYMYSTDGINWTEGTLPGMVGSSNTRLSSGNNKCFISVVNGSRTGFYYSDDCINWLYTNCGTGGSGTYPYRCIYGNNIYVAFGDSVWYSTNLSSWTKWSNSDVVRFSSGLFVNNKFIIIGNSRTNSFIYYSTDGKSWTESLNTTEFTSDNNLYYYKNTIYAVNDNSYIGFKSIDGLVWTQYTSTQNRGEWCIYNDIIYSGKYKSIDAINWNSSEIDAYKGIPSEKLGIIVANFNTSAKTNNVYTYSTLYYQFSGWNKSDFNITTDTNITASWNTVSSGDGLNFID